MDAATFIDGKSIYLRGLEEGDVASSYQRWLNDGQINEGTSRGRFPLSKSAMLEYVRGIQKAQNHLVLAICDRSTHQHIGNISLQSIDWISRNAEFAILIGDRQHQSKGIGYEAGKLILKHGFFELNLERISCGTFSNNVKMQKLAESLGMKLEGQRRRAIFKNGAYLDVLEYGILKSEFEKTAN